MLLIPARFSALQRAENSSIKTLTETTLSILRFQCSSASRKFLNFAATTPRMASTRFQCSSASRKFLNRTITLPALDWLLFQCSSASRKFLNRDWRVRSRTLQRAFQCSSASRKFLNRTAAPLGTVRKKWFQCSSASRKFLNRRFWRVWRRAHRSFSALQRAENSSIRLRRSGRPAPTAVSVLFSEPKIPQSFVIQRPSS